MKKIWRTLTGFAVLIALLMIGGLLWLTTVFDPDIYREQLVAWVKDQTKSEFSVDGEFSLHFGFPQGVPVVTVILGSASLSNAHGFSGRDFFRASKVSARVWLWPLLWGHLELDSIALEQPVIRLVRGDQGDANWQHILGMIGSRDGDLVDEWDLLSGFSAIATLGLQITDGVVQWTNTSENRNLTLTQIDFEMGSLGAGQQVGLRFNFDLQSSAIPQSLSVDAESQVERKIGSEQIRLEQLQMTAGGFGLLAGLGAREFTVDLRTGRSLLSDAFFTGASQGKEFQFSVDSAGYDEGNNQLIVDGLSGRFILGEVDAKIELSRASMQFSEQVNGSFLWSFLGGTQLIQTSSLLELLLEAVEVTGKFGLAESDWGSLLETLGLPVVERSSGLMQRVQSDGHFSISDGVLEISSFDMSVGDSRLSGSLKVENPSRPSIIFQLVADQLDIDRLIQPLIPPAEDPTIALLLPVLFFMNLDTAGSLEVTEGWWAGMKLEDVFLGVNSKLGQVRIDPFTAKLYEGTAAVTFFLDTRNDRVYLETWQNYTNVQLGALLSEIGITDRIEALGDLFLELNAGGTKEGERLAAANGSAKLAIRQGRLLDLKDTRLLGIELEQIVHQAQVSLGLKPSLLLDEKGSIEFSDFTGTLNFTQGELWNLNLNLATPGLEVLGRGKVSPTSGMIDYRLYTKFEQPIQGSSLPFLDQLEEVVLPFRLTGRLDSIDVVLDIPELLRLLVEDLSADASSIW